MVLKSGSVYPGDFKQVILLYVILLIDILVQLFQNSNKLAKNELASIHVITIGHVLHFSRILWQFTQFFFIFSIRSIGIYIYGMMIFFIKFTTTLSPALSNWCWVFVERNCNYTISISTNVKRAFQG